MATPHALARLSALLAQRAREQGLSQYAFRDIPPTKFLGLPTGEAFTIPPSSRLRPHHSYIAEALGFGQVGSGRGALTDALRGGLIRGELLPEGSEQALWTEFASKPETLSAMRTLIQATRPERVLMDVRAPLSPFSQGPGQPFGLRARAPGEALQALRQLSEALPDKSQFLAVLKTLSAMGLLPAAWLPALQSWMTAPRDTSGNSSPGVESDG
mgnify:CR=1 FL=1